jgi:hypothetical protein
MEAPGLTLYVDVPQEEVAYYRQPNSSAKGQVVIALEPLPPTF